MSRRKSATCENGTCEWRDCTCDRCDDCGSIAPCEHPSRLAASFTAHLTEEIGPDALRAVAAENARRGDDGTCASQDYCDANQTMLDSFEAVYGREADIGPDDERAERTTADCGDMETMQAAWTLARLSWHASAFPVLPDSACEKCGLPAVLNNDRPEPTCDCA